MTFRNAIRFGTLWALAALAGSACSTGNDGTDSNTHWVACDTVADCPDTAPYECRSGRCVEVTNPDGGSSGGMCPADIAGNQPCDGSIAQCWTRCTQGTRGQYVCSGGVYLAGRGLFPCGADGGTGAGDSGLPDATSSAVATDCQHSRDCEIRNRTCCGTCSEATLADKIAMSSRSAPGRDAECAAAPPCPPCVAPPDVIHAVCNAQRCEPMDLKPYATCRVDTDCHVVTKDCCNCDPLGVGDLLSLSDPAGYKGARCATVDCAPCPAPTVPARAAAHCNEGYCVFDFGP